MEDVACIPALSRTVQSWIPVVPWDEPADAWLEGPESQATRDLITAGYHMHQTARALGALPWEIGCLALNTPLVVRDHALELAKIMEQLGDWEEKEPGVTGGMGGSVSVLARLDADLNDWEANGPGPAELRRHWVAATRIRQILHKLESTVVNDMDKLGVRIWTLECMASKVSFELENWSKSPEWMGCYRCKNHVLLVLEKAIDSLPKMGEMLRKHITDFWIHLQPEDINIPGPLDIRRGPVNLRGFRRMTQQANDLAQLMETIMEQVQQWSQLINDVEHDSRE
ncbi:hypothetical protein F5144DRAFT_525163 [Chaetomium tenue]|uniref:Uncharacterized protein n=1 Tax=Chaetomium tenue TaxID=1854479 RepID=A0ACB7PQ27_9PEZI|nr:hypothetical protein F5144DRAFT_525163 [Chaetomium globosum]